MRFVLEVIDFTDQGAVGIIKTTLARPILLIKMPKVPLADDRSSVSSLFERACGSNHSSVARPYRPADGITAICKP
jgi:hypothetical protein